MNKTIFQKISASFWLSLFLLSCSFLIIPIAKAASDEAVGFAMVNGKTTGGAGGNVVVADNPDDFLKYIRQTDPLIIYVKGTIVLPDANDTRTRVTSNKTIIGLGVDATIKNRGLVLWGVSNIIIRNITFINNYGDALTIAWSSHHIWIDHNDFSSDKGARKGPDGKTYYDGLIDMTHSVDYISISWNKFHHHDKVSLVGLNGDVEPKPIHVSFYNNWFYDSIQRHPRITNGLVHVFNNYFSDISSYGIAVCLKGQVVAENNVFEKVVRPLISRSWMPAPDNIDGYITEKNNLYVQSGANDITRTATFNPSSFYTYALLPVTSVKNTVMTKSGTGKLTIVIPTTTPTPTPTSKQGDFNKDGKVDIFDYNLLVANFGKTGDTGDMNGDAKIDIFDYNIFVSVWGK